VPYPLSVSTPPVVPQAIPADPAYFYGCDVPLPQWLYNASSEAQSAALKLRRHVSAFARDNTIMLAETNSGFHEMTLNWVRSLRRINLQNYVLICLDGAAYTRLHAEAGIANAFFDSRLALLVPGLVTDPTHTDVLSPTAQSFRAPQYNQIVHFKHILLQLLLEFGFNVFLSDVDVVWHREPWSVLGAMPACDFYAQTDSQDVEAWKEYRFPYPPEARNYYLDTGLMFFRPTPATLQMMNVMAHRFRATRDGFDDQFHFNAWFDALPIVQWQNQTACAISLFTPPSDSAAAASAAASASAATSPPAPATASGTPLSFYILHPYLFMDGKHPRNPAVPPVAFHANFHANFASKQQRLAREGMWETCLL
jgi:hypothetical protein